MADETPKLRVIAPAVDIEFERRLTSLRKMLAEADQTAKLLAEIQRAHFIAKVEAGFTPAEALELVKAI